MHEFNFGKSKKREGKMMMSEKKTEIEEVEEEEEEKKEEEVEEDDDEEEETPDHVIHEHPLSLIETDKGFKCKACWRSFTEEAAYGCKKCGNEKLLHQECAEMSREIRHPWHPQHTLVLQIADALPLPTCAVCERTIHSIGYFCSSLDDEFQIHFRCARDKDVKRIGDIVPKSMMHPSHLEHPLILVKRRHTFKCDACGAMETGRSYVCITCQYWIHERCATLPATADFHHLHQYHSLSLAFYLPLEYIKFNYPCDVCDVCRKDLQIHRWVYHCKLCRYVAHIKCATGPPLPPTTLNKDTNETNAQGLIQFPIHDVYEELIEPFVVKERGGEETMIVLENHKYCAPNHHHHELIKSLVPSDHINDDDDDDDEDEDESELTICDGCTMPITSQKQKYMMSCSISSECKNFLHLGCFFLPPELPSLPLHEPDHKLVLQPCPELDFWRRCNICEFYTNGLVYSCTKCDFEADIRCASLPNTIQHQAHPNHLLHAKFIPKIQGDKEPKIGPCDGCGYLFLYGMFYKCGSCEFMLCDECALLPATNKHKLEKHPLPLTYDANLNHPDRFCCDACEEEMNPKRWMYHCRDCDTSFHPKCFPATSGRYRNIKFGHRYAVGADVHPHPLTYSLLTTKLCCDVCRTRIYGEGEVGQRGFHCPTCNFFMCLQNCGYWRLNDI